MPFPLLSRAPWLAALSFVACSIVAPGVSSAQPVLLHAAGSLRAALDEAAGEFERREASKVERVYGASGLLRERIAGGEPAQVFASANVEHPQALAQMGRAVAPLVFARNVLCALTRSDVGLRSGNLLERMLDPSLKLGTSTPKADPSGDYAFELFARAEAVRAGSRSALESKALQLTGGPNSPPPPKDRSVYGDLVATGKADVFLTYCTNTLLARRDFPDLVSVAIPAELAVGADYGLTVMRGAPEPAWRFAWFILSADGQAILAKHGFGPPR